MRSIFWLPALFLASWHGASALALAQGPSEEELKAQWPQLYRTVEVVVRAQGAPRPALKIALLPPLLDRRPGNAALVYYKLALMQAGEPMDKRFEKIAAWVDMPASTWPMDEVRQTLKTLESQLNDLDMGARRETCDWELPIRERSLFTLLMPELEKVRNSARLLSVKARFNALEGKFDEATRTLQTGFGLGQHVAQAPTVISALVGAAVQNLMLSALTEIIQQPGAPNYYWALTALPRPLCDFRRAFEGEAVFALLSFPELIELKDKVVTQDRAQQILEHFLQELATLGLAQSDWQTRLGMVGVALKSYPEAKQRLREAGRSADEVEAMPVLQVVLLETFAEYETQRDNYLRWSFLGFREAYPAMLKAEKMVANSSDASGLYPMARMLLPALSAVLVRQNHIEREIAMLRGIEAMRIFAAQHGGLPDTLGNVEDAPVSSDPLTNLPFVYRHDGPTATLAPPADAHIGVQLQRTTYHVTLQPRQ